MNKREQQREDRRKEILACGLDMIVCRGYEATKIRDIAEKLQISTGLFFNYFESKEKLYEELVKIGLHGPQSVLKLSGDEIQPIELFEKITAGIFEAIHTNSYTAKFFLLMAQAFHAEKIPDSVKEAVSQLDTITPLVPVVEKGQRLGQIKEGNPRVLLAAYWCAVQGIAESYSFCTDWPLPESSWIVDILRK